MLQYPHAQAFSETRSSGGVLTARVNVVNEARVDAVTTVITCQSAISNAVVTIAVSLTAEAFQPTMPREKQSMTNAT